LEFADLPIEGVLAELSPPNAPEPTKKPKRGTKTVTRKPVINANHLFRKAQVQRRSTTLVISGYSGWQRYRSLRSPETFLGDRHLPVTGKFDDITLRLGVSKLSQGGSEVIQQI
jgi:hypothetical protein